MGFPELDKSIAGPDKWDPRFTTLDPNHDGRIWHGPIELEVAEFLYGLVRATKPNTIVETGTGGGMATLFMSMGLKDNGSGKLYTIELYQHIRDKAVQRFKNFGVDSYIETHLGDGKEFHKLIYNKGITNINLLFLDSDDTHSYNQCRAEYDRFLGIIEVDMIVLHDILSFSEGPGKLFREIRANWMNSLLLPSARGLGVLSND